MKKLITLALLCLSSALYSQTGTDTVITPSQLSGSGYLLDFEDQSWHGWTMITTNGISDGSMSGRGTPLNWYVKFTSISYQSPPYNAYIISPKITEDIEKLKVSFLTEIDLTPGVNPESLSNLRVYVTDDPTDTTKFHLVSDTSIGSYTDISIWTKVEAKFDTTSLTGQNKYIVIGVIYNDSILNSDLDNINISYNCDPISEITTPESFENGLPVCWSIEGDSISVSTDLGGYDGTHALRMAPSDTSFLILPKVEGSIRDYRINYFAKALSDISASRTVLYAVNDNGDKIETEAFYSLDAAGTYLISSTDWSEHTMGISEMDNNDYSGYNRLAIQLKSSATTAIFYDNITLIYLKNIFTNNVGDNLWFNDTNWSLGHIPTQYENVVIPAGKVVNSTPNSENPVKPIGKVVVLEDNLTDGKAQFPISNFHKHFSIQAAFKGYSNYEEASQNSAGWYLFGIPLWVDGGNVVEMRSVFNPKEGVDDLYYWDASQASEENMGTWINWFDEETDQTNFFIYTAENRVRCYLVSYAKDTTITFTGNVYDGINYTPLYFDNNSSSFTAGNWYLFYNPHTAKINLDNIKSNYYSVPQILSVDNATYQPLEEDEGITTIDPYQGFFVQMETVPEGDTHYFYTSETTIIQAKATQQPQPNKLTLNIASNSYPKLKDLLRIKIKDDATLGFDWKTDNRKLEGLGNSPEISLLAEEERYIVNAIPQIEDSISFDIHLNSKFADNYTLSIDNKLADSYTEISLYDKQTGTLLVNFLEENTYTFYSDIYNGERFVLKMTKNPLTLDNIKKTDETITLQQNKELLKVITKDRVKHLELFNIKGQKVNSNTNNNEITIPTKGCFILNVITENKRQEFKVINL